MKATRLRALKGLALFPTRLTGVPARADDAPPPVLSLALRNTLDAWTVAVGARREPVVLDRFQASGTFALDRLGVQGTSFHVQVFRLAGSSLSERIRDIQTADAIDAVPLTRLMEAWAEKRFGGTDRSVALRVGFMDLNQDFDSTSAASLFLNSSHAVGAELARSGLSGPSIYPVSAFGARLNVAPSKRFAFRYALLDGVAGDPLRPRAFVVSRLSPRDGTLSVGEGDWRPDEGTRIAVGAWRYSRLAPRLDGKGRARSQGLYAEAERSFTKHVSAWARIGAAEGRVQPVSGYVGGGIVLKGLLAARPDDAFGVAVARSYNSELARELKGVGRAETSVELTYQFKLLPALSLQPDLQYVIDPSLRGRAPDAVVLGLRITTTFGLPKPAPATDPGDPTVTPADPAPPPAPGAAPDAKS